MSAVDITAGVGWRARLLHLASIAPEERTLGGRVSGALYAVGGLTFSLCAVLPGVARPAHVAIVAISAVATLWGVASLALVDWERAPRWLIQLSTGGALPLIACAVAASGGAESVSWVYLFFVVGFAGYFYRPALAGVYFAACVVVMAPPVLYDPHATRELFVPALAVAGPAYVALGAAILASKAQLQALRGRAEALAAEQAALQRVTAAAVAGASPADTYAMVAEDLARICGGDAAGVLRLQPGGELMVLGSWSRPGLRRYPAGMIVPQRPGDDMERALTTWAPVRVEHHGEDSPTRGFGFSCSVAVPLRLDGDSRGVLCVVHRQPGGLPGHAEDRALTFGDLLATVIAHVEDRERLARQAATDSLTGLANHRAVHERLRVEIARARRHSQALSLAVIDVDGFKHINDVAGHEVGDAVLARIAACLQGCARQEDGLGRIGGDEFAWVFPDCDRHQAVPAVERALRAIERDEQLPMRVTISAGVCDLECAADPQQLFTLADGALYWAKAQRDNSCAAYDPHAAREFSARERAARVERSQALVGLRVLARAIDAKDPLTSRHSERVSRLAAELALQSGWPVERARLLADAALVHDVGKIGVPDAVLLKEDRLTAQEYELIKGHAVLTARIAKDVLDADQIEWILGHHERPDGRGYPRGLRGPAICEGAALLALADAWDVMTLGRPYSPPMDVADALAECRALVGRQFTPGAVTALEALQARGRLDGEGVLVSG
jgi:diguanylate cyclase (GGDEF)-like protein